MSRAAASWESRRGPGPAGGGTTSGGPWRRRARSRTPWGSRPASEREAAAARPAPGWRPQITSIHPEVTSAARLKPRLLATAIRPSDQPRRAVSPLPPEPTRRCSRSRAPAGVIRRSSASQRPARAPGVRRSRAVRPDPRETSAGVYIDPRENVASRQVFQWLALCTPWDRSRGGGAGEKERMLLRFAPVLGCLLLGAVAVAAPKLCYGEATQEDGADLILSHGVFYPVQPPGKVEGSLAVRGGRIVYLGTDTGAERLRTPKTRVIDLRGRAVTPGLIDAHSHLAGLGQSLEQVDLTGAASYGEVIRRVREAARSLP